MAERVLVPEMDLSGIISESRDVAQALNSFADELEKIEKKYTKMYPKQETSLCDSCEYGDCWLRQQYGEARKYCKHYKGEGEK